MLSYLQEDIFQLVGAPLIENCMAGFNSSVFAYGQVSFRLLLFLFWIFVLCIMMLLIFSLCLNFFRREVERLIPFGVRPTPCWKKTYPVIKEG